MLTRKFLKIGNSFINTNAIRRVIMDPTEFYIELNPSGTNGFMMLGSGSFSGSDCDSIKVNKEKHPDGYKEVEKWIQEITLSENK